MSYFSPHATWMSLVESQEADSTQTDYGWSAIRLEDWKAGHGSAWTLPGSEGEPLGEVDLAQLRATRELRHRMFYHHREWEFGPALLEDTVRLALACDDREEALVYYCFARQTAQILAEEYGEAAYLPAWLELDRIIAEIHRLMGQTESATLYAKEGLRTLRSNRFPTELDALITKLAFSFMRLLTPGDA